MAPSFLNLDDDDEGDSAPSPNPPAALGAGLKRKPKLPRARADAQAIAKAGEAHGFTRSTEPAAKLQGPRRGRPPLNDDMIYWRIYLSRALRDELTQLRDAEGRRLSDVVQDMLTAYKKGPR